MSQALAVIEPAESVSTYRRLEDLADLANAEHEAVQEALIDALSHALECGLALLEAREQIAVGGWERWAKENLRMAPDHAAQYMRLAFYRDQLPASVFEPYRDLAGNVRHQTMSRVMRHYVRGLPPIRDNQRGRRISKEVCAEIRRLRQDAKMSYEKIGSLFDRSASWARNVCDPDYAASRRRRNAAIRERRRQRERELNEYKRRIENDLAIKQAGGPISLAYGHLRRSMKKVDVAFSDAHGEARQRLEAAFYHLHKAEDELVRASKESV